MCSHTAAESNFTAEISDKQARTVADDRSLSEPVESSNTADEDDEFGDFGSYFVATNGGGITHFDYSGRVLRTISSAATSEDNVNIVSDDINAIDYRNGWLIIGYQGRGVEIVNIAPEISELLSKYDEAEYDPYFFY